MWGDVPYVSPTRRSPLECRLRTPPEVGALGASYLWLARLAPAHAAEAWRAAAWAEAVESDGHAGLSPASEARGEVSADDDLSGAPPGQSGGDAARLLAVRAFLSGYAAEGGPPWLAERMLRVVTTCEGSQWAGYYGPYWGRPQFSSDTWQTIKKALGPLDPDDPYQMGRATAWWLLQIGPENAGTTAGWPVCFWRWMRRRVRKSCRSKDWRSGCNLSR